jgi:hypothetical protein
MEKRYKCTFDDVQNSVPVNVCKKVLRRIHTFHSPLVCRAVYAAKVGLTLPTQTMQSSGRLLAVFKLQIGSKLYTMYFQASKISQQRFRPLDLFAMKFALICLLAASFTCASKRTIFPSFRLNYDENKIFASN